MDGFINVVGKILGIIVVIVLAAIACSLAAAICKGFKKIYKWIYRGVAYLTKPGSMLLNWFAKKVLRVEKIFNEVQNSRYGNAVIIGSFLALFGGSLWFLLFCGIASGNLLFFLENDFLSTMPAASSLYLFFSGETFTVLPQIAAETAITSLCLLFVNKKMQNRSKTARVLFSLPTLVIGWTIGQFVTIDTIMDLCDWLDIFQVLPNAAEYLGIPILPQILRIVIFPFALAGIVLTLYFLLSLFLIALREFLAPIVYAVAACIVFAIVFLIFPGLVDSGASVVLLIVAFAAYEIWRIQTMIPEENEIDTEVENWARNIINATKAFFQKFRKTEK